VPLSRPALLFVLFVCLGETRAEVIDARVTHIGDGDSLSVCLQGREARVRLVGIDAPEYRQAYGKEARRSLAELCEGEVARLAWDKADRYGRMLARVSCRGREANAEQVRRGMAWVSDLDAPQPALQAAQRAARDAGLGLWRDPDAQPPWQWRKADRAQRRPERNAAWPGADGPPCLP
jgi:endonuclease YncB( thermonuclease family)